MVKFGTACVYMWIVWAIGKQVVKYKFYQELDEEIFAADKEVQAMKGLGIQSAEKSKDRWRDQLSFSHIFFT